EGGVALAAASLPRLVKLSLGNNGLDAAAGAALAGSPLLAPLETLWLHRNQLGDEGVQALAASPHLANLLALRLDANEVGPAGAAALAASAALGRLGSLELNENPLGDEGAAALAAAGLPALEDLEVFGCGIGAEATRALCARFGADHVLHEGDADKEEP